MYIMQCEKYVALIVYLLIISLKKNYNHKKSQRSTITIDYAYSDVGGQEKISILPLNDNSRETSLALKLPAT